MAEGNRVGVIGAGAWGTSIAVVMNRCGADVTMWVRSDQHLEDIRSSRTNQRYLPDIFIEPTIALTSQLDEIVECDVFVIAIPAQSIRTMCIALSDLIDMTKPLVIASKGIERGSLLLMSEVFSVTLPSNPVAVLSGPTFATDMAAGLPTAAVLASRDALLAQRLQFMMGGKFFRPYISDDIVSVQIGCAIKNVIAIACGIAMGAGLGDNARAAIMTRGLSEMMRLAEAKGGQASTLNGLAGLGDLMLSCASERSRNMAMGVAIGKASLEEGKMPARSTALTEGVMTAEAVYDLSMKLGVSMPICVAVADILQGRVSVLDGVEGLLSRPLGTE